MSRICVFLWGYLWTYPCKVDTPLSEILIFKLFQAKATASTILIPTVIIARGIIKPVHVRDSLDQQSAYAGTSIWRCYAACMNYSLMPGAYAIVRHARVNHSGLPAMRRAKSCCGDWPAVPCSHRLVSVIVHTEQGRQDQCHLELPFLLTLNFINNAANSLLLSNVNLF